jgi:phenylalanyl-tRNA synthetase beta chain
MGGLDSEVGPATVNILLESAQFDPLSIRRTSRKLGLMSESNYRFERGVDPVRLAEAGLRAAAMIVDLAGGELAEGMVDAWAKPVGPWPVTLRTHRASQVLGITVAPSRQKELLAHLGLSPRQEGDHLVCTIPTFRPDLTREIDLIEEVARLVGYDKIPTGGRISHAVAAEGPLQKTRRLAGQVLIACGYDEAVTPTFVDAGENEQFCAAPPVAVDTLVRRTNNVLRASLLPSLLRSCKVNQDAGNDRVNLYELAKVFPGSKGPLPDEHTELAMVSGEDLRELRGALEALVERLAPSAALEVRQQDVAGMASGSSAVVCLNGQVAGAIGVIAPAVLDRYGLEHPVQAATIHFDSLVPLAGQTRRYAPVPRFPEVRRDLSVIVSDALTWQELVEAIASVAQPMRVGLDYVTTYRGKPIPAGQKSVTLTLTYRWAEGTLRGEQVDEQVEGVLAALKQKSGADLRK